MYCFSFNLFIFKFLEKIFILFEKRRMGVRIIFSFLLLLFINLVLIFVFVGLVMFMGVFFYDLFVWNE